MWFRTKEYSIDQLLEDPTVGMDLFDRGVDRRTLELVLENTASIAIIPAAATLRTPFFD